MTNSFRLKRIVIPCENDHEFRHVSAIVDALESHSDKLAMAELWTYLYDKHTDSDQRIRTFDTVRDMLHAPLARTVDSWIAAHLTFYGD